MKQTFEKRSSHYCQQTRHYKGIYDQWALGRLCFFVIMIVLGIWAYQTNQQGWLWSIVGLGLIGFLWMIGKHQAVKQLHLKNLFLQILNEGEGNRLNNIFKRPETGFSFESQNHPYTKDLDIFGNHSIYQLVNRTRTYRGAATLAEWLKTPATAITIKLRQEAVCEQKDRIDWRQNFEATAMLTPEVFESPHNLLTWVQEPDSPLFKSKLLHVQQWLPILSALVGLATLVGLIKIGWFFLMLLGHLLILGKILKEVKTTLEKTAKIAKTLKAYGQLASIIIETPFKASYLQQLQQTLTQQQDASEAIKSLSRILTNLGYRQNAFFALFMGIPLLWDLHFWLKLSAWRSQYRLQLPQWIEAIAQIEAIDSLAGFAFANPSYTMPKISEEAFVLSAVQVGHPMILPSKRVCNNFVFQNIGQTAIITGSNMSGKSTFERTLATNIVLALAGTVVCADAFECSVMQVFTSMRTQDSLEDSTSSFYAELKRLKQLLDLTQQHIFPIFYVLDEILKGTNSKDRHDGAKALILQLQKYNTSGLISTHDVELGDELDGQPNIKNYSFYSEVVEGQLSFDYTIREGVCHSFNASQLMRQIGIEF
jgi:MutS domain V